MSQSISYSFAGKKVLVTGGGRGIGLELVTRLYNDNAKVFVLEKDPKSVETLRKTFPKITAEVCDISEWNKTQKLIASFGPLDHLVNNAAVFHSQELVSVTEEKLKETLQVNLMGAFCVTQAVTKAMITGKVKGTIVNVGSLMSHITSRGFSAYSLSKAGLRMLTTCTAMELGKYGIRCNSVTPAAVDTPLFRSNEHLLQFDGDSYCLDRQPLAGKKHLTTGEVVDSICFMLSPLSSMASGTDVLLNGGVLTC